MATPAEQIRQTPEEQVRYTPEEYLAREREADFKSEYVGGRIRAMSGASRAHNLIVTNFVRELSTQLRGRPCETYAADMRVLTRRSYAYRYPDVVVVCGEPRFEDGHLDTLVNPTLLVEVLSPSTEHVDYGEKLREYRQMETLQAYVFVAQDRMAVELYERRGDVWVLRDAYEPEHVLRLEAIGCELALRDLYERVEFPAEPDAEPAPAPPGPPR